MTIFSFHMPFSLFFLPWMFQIAPYGHEVSEAPIGCSILEYSFMSRSFSLSVFVFSVINTAFDVCIPRNIHRISVFQFRALTFVRE